MATTPVLNQFGGGMGTNNMAPGAPMAGMGNSTSSYIPMPPQGGSQNNPTGTSGGSTTASGVPTIQPGYGAGTAATTPNPSVGGSSQNQLTSIYGEGTGNYLNSLLQNNGMNLPLVAQTNAAEINGMQQQINSGSANLAGVLGAQGVSGNSSTNALAQSNYAAQATGAENSLISQNYMQEYNQGQQLLSSILGGVLGTSAQNEADKFNWEDAASLGLDVATLGVSGLAMGAFGGGGGVAGSGLTSADAAGILNL